MTNFPLSPIRKAGNFYFVSGQIGQKEGRLVREAIGEQTKQAILNIEAILRENGLALNDIVDITAFLVEQGDYSMFNEAYRSTLTEPFPSRTTVTVKSLPLGAKVELKAVAYKE